MNSSSQFMDKQIMGLSGSPNSDFFELLNPQEEQNGAEKKEEILPSYDFQPIRPQGSARAWNSAELKSNAASSRNYGALEPHELAKVTAEKDRGLTDMDMVTQIDRTMKKYADNLLHTLEGVSARLSQLETRTHHLESSVGDLKVTVGNNHGNTDGRLRQLENILREVQTGVQVLRDKQEIAEAQLQLLKMQVSKAVDQPTETPNTTQMDSLQQTISQQQQSGQPHSQPPVALLQPSHPTLPPPNAPPPPLLQNPSPPLQIPNQLPQNQMPTTPFLPRDSFYPPSSQPLDPTLSQYQLPGQQPQPVPQQPYQAPPQLPQYPQPSQLPQQQQAPAPVNPSIPPPMSHRPEENSYMSPASQTYPPNVRPPSSLSQLPSGPPPSQQFYGPNPHMYEPSGNRPGSGQLSFPGSYGSSPPGPTFNDPYPYPGPSSHYGSSSMKQPPHSSPSAPSGGSGYSRLPTAQLLPQALPTASSVSSGSGSGGTGNRVPIDDVVDKVTTMGFSRDQVRATVRRLTENGQSVDLNVVLDKLMNDGEIQPQKGWFGR